MVPSDAGGEARHSYELFRAEDGTPQLSPCAVLFLDLLGTSEPRSDDDAQRHLSVVHAALAEARQAGGSERQDQHTCVSKWFSDNLALAYPLQPGLDLYAAVGLAVAAAAAHQLSLALDGMFSRGGISFGSFYADPDFIQGPALNRAVELEKDANWPRVALDDDSATIALHDLAEHEGAGVDATWRRALMTDEEGVVFVNYLDSMELFADEADRVRAALLLHRDRVRENLCAAYPPRIREKYQRLAAYHDCFLDGLDAQLVADLYVEADDALGLCRPFGEDIPSREPEEI